MLPALLEESAANPHRPRLRDRRWLGVIAAMRTVGLAACGGGERQDANEPEARFPRRDQSARSSPPSRASLESSELTLTVRNAGEETIPDLAVTVVHRPRRADEPDLRGGGRLRRELRRGDRRDGEQIPEGDLDAAVDQALEEELAEEAGDEGEESEGGEENPASDEPGPEADGAFSVLSEQEGLAIPSRPVWILERATRGCGPPTPQAAHTGRVLRRDRRVVGSSNTFAFGDLEPGDT